MYIDIKIDRKKANKQFEIGKNKNKMHTNFVENC